MAEMIVPKSANGSLVLDACWPSVIGHRRSCRPMTNADLALWTDALSISKMSPNLCLSKPHSDDVTSVMLAIISAAFL